MKRRGFTIVEIMIVVVMITLLTLLGLATLRNTQASARDDERQAKAETIARALEVFYRNGDSSRGISPGSYPSVTQLRAALSDGYIYQWLDGIEKSTLRFSWQAGTETNLDFLGTTTAPARDQTENTSLITTAVGGGKIVYEPLAVFVGSRPIGDNDVWASCYQISSNTPTCSRYNLYFQRETDNTTVTLRSEHQ